MSKRTLGLQEAKERATRPTTFGEAIEQYLKTKARKKALAFDKLYLGQLKAAFGADTPLREISAARISGWKSAAKNPRTGQPYAAATVNRPLAALRHLFQLALEEWGVLPAVPKIRLEREPCGSSRTRKRGCSTPAPGRRTGSCLPS